MRDVKQILDELVELNKLEPRGDDEFTSGEYADAEGIAGPSARGRLAKWTQKKFIASRIGSGDRNRPTRYYRVVDWDGLRDHLKNKTI